MIKWAKNALYQIQIKVLLVLAPTIFFNKINKLDWYRNTLHQWILQQDIAFNSKVLEAGCETGSLSAFLDDLALIPTGIDASKAMIKKAKVIHNNIDFRVANIHDLSFDDEVFDIVISASLINIVNNREQALSEMIRVCKKGGIVSILVPKQGFSNMDGNYSACFPWKI